MAKIDGVVVLKSDITREESITAIKEALLAEGKGREVVDVVISDASPWLSGNRDFDHFHSFELSTSALNIALTLLKEWGNFVAKIFQGNCYTQFYNRVKERFRETRAYSPLVSRKQSAEIYVVGKGYRGCAS